MSVITASVQYRFRGPNQRNKERKKIKNWKENGNGLFINDMIVDYPRNLQTTGSNK